MTQIDPKLKEWATARQAEFIDGINAAGSMRKASRALGTSLGNLQQALAAVKKKAALHGYAPEADMRVTVPEPYILRGTSTLYDDTGALRLQWVKTKLNDQALQVAIREAVAALMDDVPPARPIRAPSAANADLCNLYTLTDCHVGMRAWSAETGEDWDLSIAEQTILGAFAALIQQTPRAGTAVVSILGDWLHFDSLAPMTPTSGNLLDADGRYSKVVHTSTRIIRAVIDQALARHARVVVIIKEGNHDMASAVWTQHLFSLLYANEPRAEVIDSANPYYALQHGDTMLAFHHGHLNKNDRLPLQFAAQFPAMWGATTRRYAHTGHLHHVEEKEHPGMKVIQHPTIAAMDAYAARHGFLSRREVTAITYHRRWGQVARVTVCPEMLEEQAQA